MKSVEKKKRTVSAVTGKPFTGDQLKRFGYYDRIRAEKKARDKQAERNRKLEIILDQT